MEQGSTSHSPGHLQEEIKCQWSLPTMKEDRSEPILEIRHIITLAYFKDVFEQHRPLIEEPRDNPVFHSRPLLSPVTFSVLCSATNDLKMLQTRRTHIQCRIKRCSGSCNKLTVTCNRDVPKQHLPLIEESGHNQDFPGYNQGFQDYLKTLPSLSPNLHFFLSREPYHVPVIVLKEETQGSEDLECLHIIKDFQLSYKDSEKEYFRINPLEEKVELAATDLNMSHKLILQQKHRSNKDAHLSMNGSVSAPDKDGVNKKDDIYKQRNPVDNTVLHLAARDGNTQMVMEMVKDTPELCTTTNSNRDTPLHVAARAGHASIIQCLLKVYLFNVRKETRKHHLDLRTDFENMLMVGLTLFRNNQGNTFFHEAFMGDRHKNNGATIFQAFEGLFNTEDSEFEYEYKEIVNFLALFATNKEGKSLLYLAIDEGCKKVVNQLLDICIKFELEPQGISPLLPAIIKKDKDMLETILSKRPTWIHLKDMADERLPLHYAAFMGFHEGVSLLLEQCVDCAMERDKDGFFPIHLASGQGHAEAIQKLLERCPDPIDFVDRNGRNFLHTAAKSGKHEVVRYILQNPNPKLEKMINQKDNNGDTPLHLATRQWHPRIVNAFTWDKRVELDLLNHEHQTALDIADQTQNRNPTLRQRLTWSALKSFGAKRSLVWVSDEDSSKDTQSSSEKEAPNVSTQYKDRINTLILVSTLIITVSFSVGFTVPGDVEEGKAVLLNHWAFHLFIFAITVSLYGSISTTIILFLAQLEDLHLALFALKYTKPLLGISLVSLSMAFLAGIYLVVSKLSWLATTFLFIAGFLVLVVALLYILLWLPSPSTSPFLRRISYYPFCVLAWVAEPEVVFDDISFPFLLIEGGTIVEG